MIRELDAAEADPRELTSSLVIPDQALRSGPLPDVRRFGSVESEQRHAREWITARLERGVLPADILVIGYSRPNMKHIAAWLCGEGIAASFLPDGRLNGTVGVSTIHGAKGLDAGHVLVLDAHELDGLEEEKEARRLLYIAMTRARDELCVCFVRPSWLIDELAHAVKAGPAFSAASC